MRKSTIALTGITLAIGLGGHRLQAYISPFEFTQTFGEETIETSLQPFAEQAASSAETENVFRQAAPNRIVPTSDRVFSEQARYGGARSQGTSRRFQRVDAFADESSVATVASSSSSISSVSVVSSVAQSSQVMVIEAPQNPLLQVQASQSSARVVLQAAPEPAPLQSSPKRRAKPRAPVTAMSSSSVAQVIAFEQNFKAAPPVAPQVQYPVQSNVMQMDMMQMNMWYAAMLLQQQGRTQATITPRTQLSTTGVSHLLLAILVSIGMSLPLIYPRFRKQ